MRIEQPNERHAILLAQSLHRFLVRAARVTVSIFSSSASPFVGNPAEVLPPILRAALPANQVLGFQTIEQPRDAWRLLDHPFRDFERGQPFVTGAAQDSQHVELLKRDAVRLDERRRLAANQVGGPHQAEHGFVRRRLERPALSQLTLQGGRHGQIDYTSIVDMSSIGRMSAMNRQIRLKSRPTGEPTADNFEAVDAPMPDARDGDVLRRTIYLSLDPYMRGRMSDAPVVRRAGRRSATSWCGHTVSQVVESRNPGFTTGDFVTGYDGWQAYGVSNGKELRKLDPKAVPISTAIGVLGMPGMTAFVGLMDIGQPKPGETVVVSAASGAVGAVVGQLAKIKGCRAVGDRRIAGQVPLRRRRARLRRVRQLQDRRSRAGAARPRVPTESTSTSRTSAARCSRRSCASINKGARIPLCGIISEYNATGNPSGPNLRPLLVQRAMIKGFIVSDHPDRAPAFVQEVAPLVMTGRIKFREDIVDGLDNAPERIHRSAGRKELRQADGPRVARSHASLTIVWSLRGTRRGVDVTAAGSRRRFDRPDPNAACPTSGRFLDASLWAPFAVK